MAMGAINGADGERLVREEARITGVEARAPRRAGQLRAGPLT